MPAKIENVTTNANEINAPLAHRMRPLNLDTYIGQQHLVGENGIIRRIIDGLSMGTSGLPSMILWGPAGVGKTTLALLIAQKANKLFRQISATSAGVKDLRELIAEAEVHNGLVVFIDEVHRFSKSQQDALLPAVESGLISLIGATTENPSFEVNGALLSRCRVYTLKQLSHQEQVAVLQNALNNDTLLSKRHITLAETDAFSDFSNGDARSLLNLLEIVTLANPQNPLSITNALVAEAAQHNAAVYDKNGENHYDIISAFIKSVRGSDANAALYWLARMIVGGEDPKFIARRLLILASEDIGLANPNALLIAEACFRSMEVIGMPEGRIILGETTIYLATSAKSNSAYVAIDAAIAMVKKTGNLPVPLHLRNGVTGFMRKEGYGTGYLYAHNYPNNFVKLEFMPDQLKGKEFYSPAKNPKEAEIQKHIKQLWG